MAFVSKEVAHAPGPFEERRRSFHIADVAGRQHQRIGAADNVGERVDLGRPSAARATDRLDLAPPFSPNAARCARMEVLSIALLFVTTPASTSGRAT